MKMKKRGLLGILFTLALVLGLLPGMAMTAYADSYGLWVGDEEVTSEHTKSPDDTWSYDASNKTLTLNGYDNKGKVHEWKTTGHCTAAIYASHDLNISLLGTNKITNPKTSLNSNGIDIRVMVQRR